MLGSVIFQYHTEVTSYIATVYSYNDMYGFQIYISTMFLDGNFSIILPALHAGDTKEGLYTDSIVALGLVAYS